MHRKRQSNVRHVGKDSLLVITGSLVPRYLYVGILDYSFLMNKLLKLTLEPKLIIEISVPKRFSSSRRSV